MDRARSTALAALVAGGSRTAGPTATGTTGQASTSTGPGTGPATGPTSTGGASRVAGKVVHFVYFVEADQPRGRKFRGAWMDGDDMTCISGATGTYPYDDANPAHCLGHVAHEFGHVLGLEHEGPDTDCMQLGFYVDVGGSGMCDFSPDNVAKILADPDNVGWFGATPGQTCLGR